jgi:diguanylate cyclase (GGDEF)-like protein
MSNDRSLFHERFRDLQASFVARMKRGADQLETSIQTLQHGVGAADATALAEVRQAVHRMAGAASTFGFPEVSKRAEGLESRLVDVQEGRASFDAELIDGLSGLVELMRDAGSDDESADEPTGLGSEQSTVALSDSDAPLVLIFDEDADLGSELVHQLEGYGYEVKIYEHPGQLLTAVEEMDPDVVLMDVIFASGRRAGIEATEELRASAISDVPVIFISSHSNLETRLRAVRAGGEDYFVKPVDASLLAERIGEIQERDSRLSGQILLVDDDLELAEYLAGILRDNGFDVETMVEPMEVLEEIRHTPPDLLLLDLYLPDYTGDELAAVLRQHEIDVGIPIVFISTESSQERRTRALMRGGDDFLFKPIQRKQLVDTVRFHLFRSRRIRRRIHIDGLTKLYNHGYLKEQLEREVELSSRQGSTVSLAMIDLDDFKHVNDEFGHQVGDGILRMLANVLRNRLRSTDIVGRYGGEEFAVILPNTKPEFAQGVMEELREAFAELEYRAGDETIRTTFTYGISSATDGVPDAETMWQDADRAMYRGKEEGKNCGVIARR